MTFEKFAKVFRVAPQSAMKREKAGDKPTRMGWTTEKDLWLTILNRMGIPGNDFSNAFEALQEGLGTAEPTLRPASRKVDVRRKTSPRMMLRRNLAEHSARAQP